MSLSDMVSLWRIFCVFAKIGAFTIGGGYAMIPIIRDELVKRGWLTDEELGRRVKALVGVKREDETGK